LTLGHILLPIPHRASLPGACIACLEAIFGISELAAITDAMFIIDGVEVIAAI
jgi:hypothetical protein